MLWCRGSTPRWAMCSSSLRQRCGDCRSNSAAHDASAEVVLAAADHTDGGEFSGRQATSILYVDHAIDLRGVGGAARDRARTVDLIDEHGQGFADFPFQA